MVKKEGPDSSYEVGYAKPPANGRFTKGQSGNPKGRPKGSRNLASVVLRECRQLVRVNGPRGSRSVTKLEAAVMQLGNKAAQGDLPSQRELFSLAQKSEETTDSGLSPLSLLERDQEIVHNILRRFERISTEAMSTSQESERKESQ